MSNARFSGRFCTFSGDGFRPLLSSCRNNELQTVLTVIQEIQAKFRYIAVHCTVSYLNTLRYTNKYIKRNTL